MKAKKNINVGFFPCYHSIGETLPALKIAKKYLESGGQVILFSHGGKFEHLVNEIGKENIKLKPLFWKDAFKNVNRDKITYEKQLFFVYKEKLVKELVIEEIENLKKNKIDLVISSFNPTCRISTKVLNIPLIVLTSGVTITPYYKSNNISFPDNYENIITRIIPNKIKNKFTGWYLQNNKTLVKDFNKVVKEYKIKQFSNLNEIIGGDYNLICDDINFLGIKPTKDFPKENFIGPITGGLFEKKEDEVEKDIQKHLQRPGKSILFMMGNTRDKNLFLKILKTLNETKYNIITVYTTISEDRLPEVSDNILLKQFIKSPVQVSKNVDLLIIHGGRGTVYNAAISGKPSIGIPMFIEHQFNIDNIVRNKAGIRISKKFFKSEELIKAISTIFSNYDEYLKNARNLQNKITKENAEEKAVERIIEISKNIRK